MIYTYRYHSLFFNATRCLFLAAIIVFCFYSRFVPSTFAKEQTITIAKKLKDIPDGTSILKDIPYVTNAHEMQKLDLLIPPHKDALPLLVWIHGGGWETGDKEEKTFYRFLSQGYAVASINYRLSQDAIYPAQIIDCKSAIRWLRAHANQYGYNPDRIGVGGSSAGGHLVALLGATSETREFDIGEYLDLSSKVQVVCDFFGPTDFQTFDIDATIFKEQKSNPFSRLLGCDPRTKMDIVAKASPLRFVTPAHAPIIIIHGNKDNLVPLDQSKQYLSALAKANVESSLYIIEGGGHGFHGENYWREITIFFAKHLKPEKRIGYTEILPVP